MPFLAAATNSVNASPGELIVLAALGVVWAVIGFRLAEQDRRRLGRSPGGLPSGLWSLLWFLGGIITAAVYLLARSRAVRRARATGILPPRPGIPPTAAPTPPVTAADLFPSYPRPANGHGAPVAATPGGPGVPLGSVHVTAEVPPTGPTAPGSEQPARPTADPPPAGGGPPPAEISPPHWHPDPSGRFHYRWWNGSEWTSTVSLNGQVLIDTSPDQRIGPYT